MASTTFVDGQTVIEAAWLNDVNAVVYTPGTSTAADIANVPAGDLVATDVQTALNELDTEKQPKDATLTALAGTLTAANKIIYATALNTAGELDFKDEDNMASNSATALPSQQSVKAYVDTEIAAIPPAITSGTAVASTSGTAIDFTAIPAGTKRITVMFSGISTNGSSDLMVQIGDAGGLETTNYLGTVWDTSGSAALSAGFNLTRGGSAAGQTHNGMIVLTLIDASTNTWCANGGDGRSDAAVGYAVSGRKALSATLDRVSIVAGGDIFDAGTINILYE